MGLLDRAKQTQRSLKEKGTGMYFESLDTAIAVYLRKEHKTQEELARDLGMAPNTFSWKRRGVDGKEFSVTGVEIR